MQTGLLQTELGVLTLIFITVLVLGIVFGVMNNNRLNQIHDALDATFPEDRMQKDVFQNQNFTTTSHPDGGQHVGNSISLLYDNNSKYYNNVSLYGHFFSKNTSEAPIAFNASDFEFYLGFSMNGTEWFWESTPTINATGNGEFGIIPVPNGDPTNDLTTYTFKTPAIQTNGFKFATLVVVLKTAAPVPHGGTRALHVNDLDCWAMLEKGASGVN